MTRNMQTVYDRFLLGFDGISVAIGLVGLAGSFWIQRTSLGLRFLPFLTWLRLGLILLVISFGFSMLSKVFPSRAPLFEFAHHLSFIFSAAALAYSAYSFYKLIR